MNVAGVRLLHIMSAADHGKATRELGWNPRPTAESIRRAAQFYVEKGGAKSRLMR
jgi:dihydroflavonol-4-reductase